MQKKMLQEQFWTKRFWVLANNGTKDFWSAKNVTLGLKILLFMILDTRKIWVKKI